MAQSKPSNLFAPANDERTGTNIKSGDPLLDGSRESRLDLILGATVKKDDLDPKTTSCSLCGLEALLSTHGVIAVAPAETSRESR